MEDRSPVGFVLGECSRGAPVDENVATRLDLCRSLALGQEIIRRVESLDKLNLPGIRVEPQDLATAGWGGVHLAPFAVLGAMGGIVVETDNLYATFLREPTSVVLEAELCVIGYVEIALLSIETPDNGAVRPVYLMYGTGIPSRYEVVAVSIFVDAIDVKVVPCIGTVVTRTRLAGIDGKDGFCEGY